MGKNFYIDAYNFKSDGNIIWNYIQSYATYMQEHPDCDPEEAEYAAYQEQKLAIDTMLAGWLIPEGPVFIELGKIVFGEQIVDFAEKLIADSIRKNSYLDIVTITGTQKSDIQTYVNAFKSGHVSRVEVQDTNNNWYIEQFNYNSIYTNPVPTDMLGDNRGNDTIIGNNKGDVIYGFDGDDSLVGGGGDDFIDGGYGNDKYDCKNGHIIIRDVDGIGSVKFNNKTLIGASKYPLETAWTDGGITYEWAGIGYPGECYDLTIKSGKDKLIIKDFHNGDLGIHLKMKPPVPPRTYCTAELNDIYAFDINWWHSSPFSSDTFVWSVEQAGVSGSWSMGYTNLKAELDGEGKWVLSGGYGTAPYMLNAKVTCNEINEYLQSEIIFNQWKQAYPEDPVILDLDGDGVELVSKENKIYFDLDNSGFAENTAWVNPDDGVLALDRNQNGIIDNGNELFTFETLSELDTNEDGKIDENDEEFANLKILKGDGTILTMDEAGIKSLNLNYTADNTPDEEGNTRIGVSTYTKLDDTTGEMSEFNLSRSPVDSKPLEWVDVPTDVALLPDIQGTGNTYSLQQAMARDESGELKALIQQFIDEENPETIYDLLDDILFKWTNSDGVDPESRGDFDARKLATLESFMGTLFEASNTSVRDSNEILKFNNNLRMAA